MTRGALVATTALIAVVGPTEAAELPIREGVAYCTDAIEIDKTGIYGPDHQCFAVNPATDGGAVLLLCEPGEPAWGPPWVDPVTIIEDIVEGRLLYVDHDGPSEIEPCPPPR